MMMSRSPVFFGRSTISDVLSMSNLQPNASEMGKGEANFLHAEMYGYIPWQSCKALTTLQREMWM
jgi:hypothetical protein